MKYDDDEYTVGCKIFDLAIGIITVFVISLVFFPEIWS